MKTSLQGGLVLTTGLLVVLASVTSACAHHQFAEQAFTIGSTPPPTAQPVPPDPRVGIVYDGGERLCTGGVLDSPAGDLIVTAGHCVAAGQNEAFVAGLTGTAAPTDFWRIDMVYLDPRWVQYQDPVADFAIARVSRDAGGSVEAQPGAGLKLGTAPQPGAAITVSGYALNATGGPVGCRTAAAATVRGFPEADCAQMLDGTSGSPWIEGSTVVGVIGGLDGGGCEGQTVNYSPPFGDAIKQLLARAEAGGPSDAAPEINGDVGCP
jgi:hypothetical protein